MCGVLLAWGPGTAAAQGNGSGRFITFAARWCPSYTDVYNNITLNDLVEHLEPLGAPSQYPPKMAEGLSPPFFTYVTPQMEDFGIQSLVSQGGHCEPLPGWEFTLGTGKLPQASLGPWGGLSIVTGNPALPDWPSQAHPFPGPPCAAGDTVNACAPRYDATRPDIFGQPSSTPFPTPIVTQSVGPLYTSEHQPTGEQLPGSVTYELTQDEANAMSACCQCGGYTGHLLPREACQGGLYAMAGTPTDPVLARMFHNADGSPVYGFATLRCGPDNALADNAEVISFPEGVTNIFCFAYFIKPSPEAGTITIHKVVEGNTDIPDQAFDFHGSLSFAEGGLQLKNGEDFTFHRAAPANWGVTEDEPVGFHLVSITCNAVTDAGTTGQSTASISGTTAVIHLVAGEHVDCTFTNMQGQRPPGLTITKITQGGVGTFRYRVTGGGTTYHSKATTLQPDIAVDAVGSLPTNPGTYRITELAPSSPGGFWRLQSVTCDDVPKPTTGPVTVTINDMVPNPQCVFTNKFIPRGSISISKVTQGATGTTQFIVSGMAPTNPETPFAPPSIERRLSATTTTEGVPAAARPDTQGLDNTDQLRLGQYQIVEQTPNGNPAGEWTLNGVQCNGIQEPFAQGRIEVTLTRNRPHLHCVFTNIHTPHPAPEPPPGPDPLETADLSVTKQPSTSVASTGDLVTFRITVTNHGPDPAAHVILHDQLFGSATLVSIQTNAGSCSRSLPIVCQLGTMAPGARAHVTVRLRITSTASHFRDRAVVGTATDDPNLANNVDSATVRLTRPSAPPAPPFTG